MQQKHVEHALCLYVCQAAGASIIGGGAPSWFTWYITIRLQARSGRQKSWKMVLTLFKNGFYLHPNTPKYTPDPRKRRRVYFVFLTFNQNKKFTFIRSQQ